MNNSELPIPSKDVPEYHTECRYPDCQCERVSDPNASFGFRLECEAPPLPPKLDVLRDEPSAKQKVNINDEVFVRLTSAGAAAWNEYWRATSPEGVPDSIRKGAEYQSGYTKFQIWEMMAIFGPDCFNGSNRLPFVNNELWFDIASKLSKLSPVPPSPEQCEYGEDIRPFIPEQRLVLPIDNSPIYPQGPERAQFERWWLSLCEEAEQGPTPEEETFAWAAWQYRAAIARGEA